MDLLNDFSPGLFVMQAVILLILILLMRKFAWKPILESLNTREEGIKDALEAADNAKKELQNLNAENERVLNEARTERDSMLKEAREMKASMIASAKEEAQAEADKVIKQAQEAIVAEKKSAIADLKNQVAGISVEIAEKVVKTELADKNKQLELVSSLLEEVTLN